MRPLELSDLQNVLLNLSQKLQLKLELSLVQKLTQFFVDEFR